MTPSLRSFAHLLAILFVSLQVTANAIDDGKHLFILSGQSNMQGLRPEESFTPAVVKAFGKENVIVVHDAHGGQPIRRWDKGWKSKDEKPSKQKPADLYSRLMAKVQKAVGQNKLKSVTFLWMQGERDAREKNADLYLASLKRLVAQVAEDTKHKSVHVVIGRLSDFDMENKRYPHWTKIREVQVEFAKSRLNTAWVNTDDLNDGRNRRGKEIKNDLHYSGEGYKVFGERLAKQAIAMIKRPADQSTPKRESENPGLASTFTVSFRADNFAGTLSEDQVDLNAAKPDRLIEYKTVGNTKLHLHVFEPKNHQPSDKRPAVVFFFGGGWNGGTPSQFYKQSRYLAHRGLIAFCAEYRTRSKNKTSPRECVKDGKSAIRFVRSRSAKLGVDPKRIAAGGGSAGGHVAAATATVNGFDEETDSLDVNPRPNALLLFNPVYDNSKEGYGYDRVKDYWKDFSPMHNLSKSTPPTIVFLGTKDKLIPVATGKAYQSKMKELGCRSDLHLYDEKPHGFFNTGESFVDTVEKMDQFLVSLKYLEGEPDIRKLLPNGPTRKKPAKKKATKKKKNR